MSSNEAKALKNLLTSFNATWLGEGDINAGTNLLVAKAATLANLSRVGSGIQVPGLSRMRGGCSLLVSGSLSASLVMDDVVTEVAIRQNVLTAQLRRLIGDKMAEADKKGQTAAEFPGGPEANFSENALLRLEQRDSLIPLEPEEQWTEVLGFPPNPRIDDLAARPKMLVTSKGPRDLEKQLSALHGGRPLVAIGLNEPADASAYADICAALLNGLLPVGEGGETAMGHLLVNDPGCVLERIAPTAGRKAAWLGRMPWLVDGDAGPDAVEKVPDEGRLREGNMGGRFGEALTNVLVKRLNNHNPGTEVREFDLTDAQIRWVTFLKKMQGRLPGITGTARGLLATLAFGLIELANAPKCKRLPVTPEGVEALGRWVIERMANARAAMVATAEREWRLHLAQRILFMLSEGSRQKRDIYRSLGIRAGICDELLFELESAGLVRRRRRRSGSA